MLFYVYPGICLWNQTLFYAILKLDDNITVKWSELQDSIDSQSEKWHSYQLTKSFYVKGYNKIEKEFKVWGILLFKIFYILTIWSYLEDCKIKCIQI